MTDAPLYGKGDRVRKTTGDYRYEGVVVAAFYKLDGLNVRYVVEDPRGLLFIFSGQQLNLVERAPKDAPSFPVKPRLADILGVEDVELPSE